MLFNNIEYIFIFLPISLVFVKLAENIKINKTILLFIFSIIFIFINIKYYIIFYFFISILNYLISKRLLDNNDKKLLIFDVSFNVLSLLFFKYVGIFNAIANILPIKLENIVIPLGYSFFSFQQIMFVVSAYRKEIKELNYLDYLLYVFYYPKFIIGPLVEPKIFLSNIKMQGTKSINLDDISCGIKMFSFGLFKKVMLADVLCLPVEWVFNNVSLVSSMDCFLAMIFYTFYIYFDFSGYCDMATGISLMYGIKLPINFNSPYKSTSICNFWKRWHITLTKFFTRYVYIPLGGNRKGLIITYINTLIVFTLSGLWHGSTFVFVLWGLLNGLLVVFEKSHEKYLDKIPNIIRFIINFIVVGLLWILFNSNSVSQWIEILKNMFSFADMGISHELSDTLYVYSDDIKFINSILHLNSISRYFWINALIALSSIICFVSNNNY